LGITPLAEALAIARTSDLDLVEVAPDAQPPVCRIMDYNRFKYEAAQRAKESRRKSTTSTIKEMKYRPKIGPGDFDTKTRAVEKFLKEGHKVKITIMFRGREVAHSELGMKILDRIAEHCVDFSKLEAVPRLDGRNMTMVLAPDKRSAQSTKAKSAPTTSSASTKATAPAAATASAAPASAAPAPAPAPEVPAPEPQPTPDDTAANAG